MKVETLSDYAQVGLRLLDKIVFFYSPTRQRKIVDETVKTPHICD